MGEFTGQALGPIWKFRVDFPEEGLFMAGKEGQPRAHDGSGGCLGEEANECIIKDITCQECKL